MVVERKEYMKKKYIVSLELAKQLKEAGISQESEWYWVVRGSKLENEQEEIIKLESGKGVDFSDDTSYIKWISAFHVGELAELLPWCIHRQSEMPFCLEIRKMIESADPSYEWTVRYIRGANANEQIPFTREHLAEAMGECLLFIKNKKYI